VATLHWFRTALYLLPAITLYTVFFGTLSVLSNLWDRAGYFGHRCARGWAYMILATTRVVVEVRGLDRLVPGATYVFVANHQSLYDIPVVFWYLPYQLRIIAKESLGRVPFVGWHLRRAGNLLVDRSNPDRAGILSRWRVLLHQRLSLIIFAEGTRNADGRVARFKAGSFLLAIEAGMPVVPVSITGTRLVMRKGRFTVRPGRVTMTIHEPLVTTGGAWQPTIEDARRLAEQARRAVASAVEGGETAEGQGD
jgi:1-acyl-sn-glycerol-3-phosphate acyltransferase